MTTGPGSGDGFVQDVVADPPEFEAGCEDPPELFLEGDDLVDFLLAPEDEEDVFFEAEEGDPEFVDEAVLVVVFVVFAAFVGFEDALVLCFDAVELAAFFVECFVADACVEARLALADVRCAVVVAVVDAAAWVEVELLLPHAVSATDSSAPASRRRVVCDVTCVMTPRDLPGFINSAPTRGRARRAPLAMRDTGRRARR